MSEMEYHHGTAMKICSEVKGFRAKIEEAVKNHGLVLDECQISWDYNDLYHGNHKFVFLNGELWKLDNHTVENGECFSVQDSGDPNKFHYSLSWYNGGGGFDEAFEEGIENVRQSVSSRKNN